MNRFPYSLTSTLHTIGETGTDLDNSPIRQMFLYLARILLVLPQNKWPTLTSDGDRHQKVVIKTGELGMQLRELVEYMAKSLVDDIGGVDVQEIQGELSSMIQLRVSKGDLGKIIGKRGRNAGALRTIVTAVAAKHRRRVLLEIVE